jgi:antitoxin MazE
MGKQPGCPHPRSYRTLEIGVTVKPVGPRKLTLAEKLAKFDPATHGSEAMVTGRIGTEVF